ncbi:hypothetical protein DFH09DRAFT_1111227 [Mycena vulgaris]|nr:hypothetical protein DFH09DRAFT_1111227 [Mycena vulgaris]
MTRSGFEPGFEPGSPARFTSFLSTTIAGVEAVAIGSPVPGSVANSRGEFTGIETWKTWGEQGLKPRSLGSEKWKELTGHWARQDTAIDAARGVPQCRTVNIGIEARHRRVSFPGPVLDEDEQEGDESIVFLRQRAAELRRLAEIFEAQADTGQQGIASPIWRNSMMRRDVGRDAAQVVEDVKRYEGHNRSRDRTWEGTERRQNTMGHFTAVAKLFPNEAKWHVVPDSAGSLGYRCGALQEYLGGTYSRATHQGFTQGMRCRPIEGFVIKSTVISKDGRSEDGDGWEVQDIDSCVDVPAMLGWTFETPGCASRALNSLPDSRCPDCSRLWQAIICDTRRWNGNRTNKRKPHKAKIRTKTLGVEVHSLDETEKLRGRESAEVEHIETHWCKSSERLKHE